MNWFYWSIWTQRLLNEDDENWQLHNKNTLIHNNFMTPLNSRHTVSCMCVNSLRLPIYNITINIYHESGYDS